MHTKTIFSVVAVAMLGAVQVRAQDSSAGEELYQSVCKNCHGPTARGMASFPKLAGQPTDYLMARLQQYRADEKVGPNTALMQPHATGLSDEDIANLAAYISTF